MTLGKEGFRVKSPVLSGFVILVESLNRPRFRSGPARVYAVCRRSKADDGGEAAPAVAVEDIEDGPGAGSGSVGHVAQGQVSLGFSEPPCYCLGEACFWWEAAIWVQAAMVVSISFQSGWVWSAW